MPHFLVEIDITNADDLGRCGTPAPRAHPLAEPQTLFPPRSQPDRNHRDSGLMPTAAARVASFLLWGRPAVPATRPARCCIRPTPTAPESERFATARARP